MATMQIMDTRQANSQFGTLLNVIQEGNAVTITQGKENIAVILSPYDFELLGGEKRLLSIRANMERERAEAISALRDMASEAQKNGLTQEILDDIIADAS